MATNLRPSHIKLGIQQTKARNASYAIPGADSGIAFSNTGAPGAIVLALPNATVGEEFWFYVNAAHALTVTASTLDTIGAKGAGSSYASSAVGNFLWVKCFIAGVWTLAINVGFV